MDFSSIARMTKDGNASSNARIFSDEVTKALEEYQSSLILDILDEDGMVIIDGKLFQLDFVNRLVAVTPDLSLRESLLRSEYESDLIYLFSFDDDVIGLIEQGSKGTIFSKSKIELENRRLSAFYVGDNCDWDECRFTDDVPGSMDMDYRIEAKHVYQSSGIYFKLFSQAKHMKKSAPPLYSGEFTDIRIYWDYWYKSKKSSIGIQQDIDFRTKWDDDLEAQYYSSSRGLESYRLDSRFYVQVGGDHGNALVGFSYWDFDLYRINKGL